MKKIIVILVISFILFIFFGLLAREDLNYGIIEKTYNYTNSDILIDKETDLSLLSYDYENVNYGILCYNNDKVTKNDNGSVSSIIVGKNCIGIMANIFDVETNLNKSIMIDLVKKLRDKLNGDNSEIVVNNSESLNPYIISKNDECIFIDYVTGSMNDRTKVIYYRIIIQDVHQLGLELTEEQYNSLEDYLPNLLNILQIPIEEIK